MTKICHRCGRSDEPMPGVVDPAYAVTHVTVEIGGGKPPPRGEAPLRGKKEPPPGADLCDYCRLDLRRLVEVFLAEVLPSAKGVGKP